MIYDEDPFRRRPRKSTARWKRQEKCVWMATKMVKWASNDDQIIKSRLPDGRRAKFFPSVVGLSYDGRELKVIWGISVKRGYQALELYH